MKEGGGGSMKDRPHISSNHFANQQTPSESLLAVAPTLLSDVEHPVLRGVRSVTTSEGPS